MDLLNINVRAASPTSFHIRNLSRRLTWSFRAGKPRNSKILNFERKCTAVNATTSYQNDPEWSNQDSARPPAMAQIFVKVHALVCPKTSGHKEILPVLELMNITVLEEQIKQEGPSIIVAECLCLDFHEKDHLDCKVYKCSEHTSAQ